jgi:hypothetical protein
MNSIFNPSDYLNDSSGITLEYLDDNYYTSNETNNILALYTKEIDINVFSNQNTFSGPSTIFTNGPLLKSVPINSIVYTDSAEVLQGVTLNTPLSLVTNTLSVKHDNNNIILNSSGELTTAQAITSTSGPTFNDLSLTGHIVSSVSANPGPTISNIIGGTNLLSVSISGSDTCGQITFTTGSTRVANTLYMSVTFGTPYAFPPKCIMKNQISSSLNDNYKSLQFGDQIGGSGVVSTTSFYISTIASTIDLNSTYVYSYLVIG